MKVLVEADTSHDLGCKVEYSTHFTEEVLEFGSERPVLGHVELLPRMVRAVLVVEALAKVGVSLGLKRAPADAGLESNMQKVEAPVNIPTAFEPHEVTVKDAESVLISTQVAGTFFNVQEPVAIQGLEKEDVSAPKCEHSLPRKRQS